MRCTNLALPLELADPRTSQHEANRLLTLRESCGGHGDGHKMSDTAAACSAALSASAVASDTVEPP